MKVEESNGVLVGVDGKYISIRGMWTLPISVDVARKMLTEGYPHGANDGLFPIPGTDKTCLSVVNENIAKIALTERDICNLRKILCK